MTEKEIKFQTGIDMFSHQHPRKWRDRDLSSKWESVHGGDLMAMDKAMRVFNIFSDDDAAGVQFQFSSRRCAGLDRTLCLHTCWEAAKKAQSNPGAEPFFSKLSMFDRVQRTCPMRWLRRY